MTNFEPSFDEPSREQGTPLTDFWGTGAGWGVKKAGKTDFNIMVMRSAGPGFKVESSAVPYPHETAEIEIFYSDPKTSFKRQANRGISEWLAFSDSVRELYPEGMSPTAILDDMFGGRVDLVPEGQMPTKPGRLIHWVRTATLLNAKDAESGKWTDQMLPAWKVVEVSGIGSGAQTGATNGSGAVEIMSYALDLANGKTEVAFYAEAMDDMKLLGNPGIVEQFNKRTWVPSMKAMGQLKEVEGVLVRT